MLEHFLELVIPEVASILELIALVFIIFGMINALVKKIFPRGNPISFRSALLKVFETGLEILLGAEIIKTILVKDYLDVLLIGGIILLRVSLTLIINYESQLHFKIQLRKEKTASK
jgi:uncharacterized membrane protein